MRRKTAIWFALLASTCLAPLRPSLAGELPAGPSVVHGSVGIAVPSANIMTMQQSSATAIVNWQSFSVGTGAAVNIQQPSTSSALLNRVTGAATSTIAGQISANGQVYLVNPNGIVITPSGTVRAGGGFVASTLGIGDEDFKAGRRSFTGNGASAAVVNRGTIEVGRGGYAALLGGSVENAGTISVPMGRVGLGAGEQATLDISGDGFLQVAVPSGSAGEKALIQHSGRIRANGGRVEMQAATAREVARQAINLTGVVEARTVGGRSGAIVLGGGAGGTVQVSGRLLANATRQGRRTATAPRRAPGAQGGEITITGDRIGFTGATLDASGRTGGGTIRIGGDLQGRGPLPNARTTIVDGDTRISADATESGNGGTVILWSDVFTSFGGLISARGGANGGDGGFAEVSSKGVLSYTGRTILTAARGRFGTLLLDPYDIYIESGPTTNGALSGSPPDLNFTPSGPNSVINVTTLQDALATANVTIQTGGSTSPGTQAGNITVGAPISWSQPTTLRLDAFNNIIIGEAISGPAGALSLAAGGTITTPLSYGRSDGSTVISATPSGAINVGTFLLESGTWTQSGGPLPGFQATDFRLEGGSFLRVLGGDGSIGNPYAIGDVYGLQGINSTDLTLNYRLANDIDASGTSQWSDGSEIVGFTPIGGSISDGPAYSGTFDGQGHTISGLFINRPFSFEVGLFGQVTGTVRNLSLANVSITGGSYVGSVAGENLGTISHVRASGTVTGAGDGVDEFSTAVGGLVGGNTGTVSQSYASTAVSAGPGSESIGGLVGLNGDFDGGTGTIFQSYAIGTVTAGPGSSATGGLVGSNLGSVSQSYATAAVSGDGTVGGLIGENFGPITASFWDTATSGQPLGIGMDSTGTAAPTGLTTTQFQNAGFFVPLARAQGWNFEADWAPPSPGFYPELYSMAPVIRMVTGDATRFYGDPAAFPVLATYGGPGVFVFGPAGDAIDLSNAITSPATAASPVGFYGIAGANQTSAQGVGYRIVVTQPDAAFTPGLTVIPAPLIIAANNQAKAFGVPFSFTGLEFTAAGLRNGETIGSATLSSTGALATALAGLYPILIGNAAGGTFDPANYAISYVPGTMIVGAGTVPLSENSQAGLPELHLPVTTVSLPNPPDSFDLTIGGGGGSGGGGPTLGTGRPGELDAARSTLAAIERSSNELEAKVANCENRFQRQKAVSEYKTCVGDALEQYADALDAKALSLPGPMRGIPAVIRQAARQVRTARTIQEARAAVGAALVEVRKAIALIRADDPAIGQLQLRQANRIASALGSVETRLSRATGL